MQWGYLYIYLTYFNIFISILTIFFVHDLRFFAWILFTVKYLHNINPHAAKYIWRVYSIIIETFTPTVAFPLESNDDIQYCPDIYKHF